MPPAADTPSKPLKRHRRKTKTTSISQNHLSGLSDDAASRQTKSDLDLPEPESEAKPPTMFDFAPGDHAQDHQIKAAGENEKRKQTPRKHTGGRPNGASPMPRLNSTPRKNHESISLTPGRKSSTPSQAYAGPTFHASPAASSLPMPRFFSKSVPDANKEKIMQTAMEKETTEESSEQSEGSPSPAFARRLGEEQAREESPLDIFFKADREQKKRLRKDQGPPLGAPDLLSGTFNPERPRNHSRQSTSGSMGAVFPMELENKEAALISSETPWGEPRVDNITRNVSMVSPSAGKTETPQQAEQRKAKTIALKKFLLSSVPSSNNTSSALEPPPLSIDQIDAHNTSSQQPKDTTNPQIYKQLAAQSARQMSPCPRPSSKLRKEMSASALPNDRPLPELPATPTPTRTRNAYRSAPADVDPTPLPTGDSSASPMPASSKRPTLGPARAPDSSPYQSMEDDLRRILKMDVLSNDGATGVRS